MDTIESEGNFVLLKHQNFGKIYSKKKKNSYNMSHVGN